MHHLIGKQKIESEFEYGITAVNHNKNNDDITLNVI